MSKRYFFAVQQLTVKVKPLLLKAVNLITDDRMTNKRRMNPYLVSSARFQFKSYQSVSGKTLDNVK